MLGIECAQRNGKKKTHYDSVDHRSYAHEILYQLRKAVDFRLACHHVAFDFEVIYFVVRQIS